MTEKPELPLIISKWNDFKTTSLFGNLISHVGVENMGALWGVFYEAFHLGAAYESGR